MRHAHPTHSLLSPKVLASLFRTAVIASGAFLVSRRWLIGSIAVTGLLLALVIFAKPVTHLGFNTSEDSGTMFDEVKRLPLGSKGTESQFHPGTLEPLRFRDEAPNLSAAPLELAPDESADGPASEIQQRGQVGRRLDAVRSRQARGAWLTGTIEPAAETPGETVAPPYRVRANAPQQSALQTPSSILR